MCGIGGLYLKNPELHPRLGELFAPMLIEMTDRGPDSAGIAVYREDPAVGAKVCAYSADMAYDWNGLARQMGDDLGIDVRVEQNSTHALLQSSVEGADLRGWLERERPDVRIMSSGRGLEIYKEVGLPETVIERFGIPAMSGSHAVGHTRMATESAVTTAATSATTEDARQWTNARFSNRRPFRRT